MPSTVKFNPVLGIIETTCSGKLKATELKQIASKAISLGKQFGTKLFLSDVSELIQASSIWDIYTLIDTYEKEGLDRQSRHAVILPKSYEGRQTVHLYEIVCMNHGWLVKLFTDRQSAVDYLMGLKK